MSNTIPPIRRGVACTVGTPLVPLPYPLPPDDPLLLLDALTKERDAIAARLAEVTADRDRLREACRVTVRAGTELGIGWGTAFNAAQNALRQSEEVKP